MREGDIVPEPVRDDEPLGVAEQEGASLMPGAVHAAGHGQMLHVDALVAPCALL